MKRRKFIVSAAAAVPAITLFPSDLSGMARETVSGRLEKRSLGRTGEMLSVIGFGDIVVMNATPDEASEAVKMAIDAGVNYFDVAPWLYQKRSRWDCVLPFRIQLQQTFRREMRISSGRHSVSLAN